MVASDCDTNGDCNGDPNGKGPKRFTRRNGELLIRLQATNLVITREPNAAHHPRSHPKSAEMIHFGPKFFSKITLVKCLICNSSDAALHQHERPSVPRVTPGERRLQPRTLVEGQLRSSNLIE